MKLKNANEAPMYYILSLFCIVYRFRNLKISLNEFGDRIFGKIGESKFLKDFMPLMPIKIFVFKNSQYHLVSN
jgi:hypothetical protein